MTSDEILARRLPLRHFTLVDSVDGADVGGFESRSSLGFRLKPSQCAAIFGHCFRQDIQGDEAVRHGVLGPVDESP